MLTRNESGAIAILHKLEVNAAALDSDWPPGEVEDETGARRQALLGPGLYLVAEEGAESLLAIYRLYLEQAHTLIALAKLGVERFGSFEQAPRTAWPPAQCRHCGSPNILISGARIERRRQTFDVNCRDCGQAMIEIGPPLARSAPGAPKAS